MIVKLAYMYSLLVPKFVQVTKHVNRNVKVYREAIYESGFDRWI